MKKPFKTPQQLQQLIDSYFESLEPEIMYDSQGNMVADKNGEPVMTERKPATVASMVYAVGLSSKEDFLKLQDNPKYRETVKRSLLRTEAYIERMLFDKAASGGAKYLLQESFGHCVETEEDSECGSGVVVLSELVSNT